MDAKLTLSFDEQVISEAKIYAESQGLSLSRLTEILYRKIIEERPYNLEDFKVAEWVSIAAEGPATYERARSTKDLRKELRASKK
jgi:antitoxin component of RelBE/YafQ-DinJ toxin-antitoxin module